MIALVRFPKSSFDKEYAYKTDIDNLEADDLVIVPTNESYSVAIFTGYTDLPQHAKQATKSIVCSIEKQIEEYEESIFLYG